MTTTKALHLRDDQDRLTMVRVGHRVGFKYGVEQSGRVVEIDRDRRSMMVDADGATIEVFEGEFWTE